ncbi:MAG TPA: HAD-IB family hydrolase [Chitinophagales bacterium]
MKYNGIAFFDLDETITSKDTLLEFIKFVVGKRYFWFGIIVLSPLIVLFLLKIYPSEKLKENFFSFYLKRHTEKELLQKGKEFCNTIMPQIVYPKALEKIEWFKSENYRIIIITASSSIWLGEWCKQQNVEISATEFEVKNLPDGQAGGRYYTGKIAGKNNYGKEKAVRVKKILAEGNYPISYGYGDSKADLHFMELTDESELGSFA